MRRNRTRSFDEEVFEMKGWANYGKQFSARVSLESALLVVGKCAPTSLNDFRTKKIKKKTKSVSQKELVTILWHRVQTFAIKSLI